VQVEGFATEKACLSRDPSLVEKLKRHNNTMLEAMHARDQEATLAGNQAFHFEIYKAAAYPQLLDIISSLWLRTGPILAIVQNDQELFYRIFQNGHRVHNDAIDAIGRRDRVAARRAIGLDLRAAHKWIRRHYKSMNEARDLPERKGSLSG
jgi:DNA-binding GntR family transcriptional regulator